MMKFNYPDQKQQYILLFNKFIHCLSVRIQILIYILISILILSMPSYRLYVLFQENNSIEFSNQYLRQQIKVHEPSSITSQPVPQILLNLINKLKLKPRWYTINTSKYLKLTWHTEFILCYQQIREILMQEIIIQQLTLTRKKIKRQALLEINLITIQANNK